MKKYLSLNVILVGIILVLAAVLVGVLIFARTSLPHSAFEPLVEIKAMEPDSSLWGQNFPTSGLHCRRPKPTTWTQPMEVHPSSLGSSATRAR
jgi:hypothetical protein